jgi:predicted lipoprotein with Yx(FWY)xxD motif
MDRTSGNVGLGSAGRLRAAAVALCAVAALGAAACSSSATSQNAPAGSASPTTAASATSGGTVDTATTSLGRVLVDASGHTLYLLTADSATSSVCTGSCAGVWPPLTVTGSPTAGPGVDGSKLATITLAGGTKQVTYAGHPLYTYAGDAAAGDVGGQGIHSFGGTWEALTPSGAPVTAASSPTTTAASSGY